jgi:hypothetical protein
MNYQIAVWNCKDGKVLVSLPGELPKEDVGCPTEPREIIEITGPRGAIRKLQLGRMSRADLEDSLVRLQEHSCHLRRRSKSTSV